jgi:hypothetical protein
MSDGRDPELEKQRLEMYRMELDIRTKQNERVMELELMRLSNQKKRFENILFFLSLIKSIRYDQDLELSIRLKLEDMATKIILESDLSYPVIAKLENRYTTSLARVKKAALGPRPFGYTTRSTIRKFAQNKAN